MVVSIKNYRYGLQEFTICATAKPTAFVYRQQTPALGPEHAMNDRNANNGPEDGSPDSAAQYIATLAAELAQLARLNGFDTLSYLLEMARLEADQVTKG